MSNDVPAYRWTCPICSATKLGLATVDTITVEEQAANALTSHVRTRIGGGHARKGDLPRGFDSDDVLGNVDTGLEVDDPKRLAP